MMKKVIEVYFYKSSTGKEPVREWLLGLDADDKKSIGVDIKAVEFGFPMGLPLVKKIEGESKLWEVRSHLKSDKIARILFTIKDDKMILLHGFIKKSQKLSGQDKQTALSRKKEFDLGGLK